MNKKPNSIPSAGTKADSEQKDEDLFVSQHSSKPLVGSSACQSERKNELANKWIKELSDAGFTPDEMIAVFREARRKFDNYKKRKK